MATQPVGTVGSRLSPADGPPWGQCSGCAESPGHGPLGEGLAGAFVCLLADVVLTPTSTDLHAGGLPPASGLEPLAANMYSGITGKPSIAAWLAGWSAFSWPGR